MADLPTRTAYARVESELGAEVWRGERFDAFRNGNNNKNKKKNDNNKSNNQDDDDDDDDDDESYTVIIIYIYIVLYCCNNPNWELIFVAAHVSEGMGFKAVGWLILK